MVATLFAVEAVIRAVTALAVGSPVIDATALAPGPTIVVRAAILLAALVDVPAIAAFAPIGILFAARRHIVAAICLRTALVAPALALAARLATAIIVSTRASVTEDPFVNRFDPGKRLS